VTSYDEISEPGEHVAIPEDSVPVQALQSSSGRISVPEIARRLDIGRLTVYTMLEQGILPGLRLGRRWIITRHAYEQWERTCGTRVRTGLHATPELPVVLN
jgi:excisionase family DNA binding protein